MSSARERSKEAVEMAFAASGERERIKDILITRLREEGWNAEVKRLCREHIRQHGIESVSAEDMYQEIRGPARKAVPEEIKRELLVLVRNFVKKELNLDDL